MSSGPAGSPSVPSAGTVPGVFPESVAGPVPWGMQPEVLIAIDQHLQMLMEQATDSDMAEEELSTDSSNATPRAPFDGPPGQPSEPEPEPGTGEEVASAFGEIDYAVQIANEFSMRFGPNQTVQDLKMAICYDMRHLQPGDLNVYWRHGSESDRLSDGCLLAAIPADRGHDPLGWRVVVVNDGR